jgi:hypothetical protein
MKAPKTTKAEMRLRYKGKEEKEAIEKAREL